ncbi:MAG TPA: hypothetical protein VJT82_08420, partial [Pyrinomonadaceae bacterium]|nr:hypothetical protein [Pyrinomonadaceae bacterium]
IRHIRQIPAISERLSQGEGLRVLFIGNSMTRYGVEPEIVEREITAQGVAPLRVELVFPDATALPDWYYAFQHYFTAPGHAPDVLVVCFARNDLQDNLPVQSWRLAQYYTGLRDVPEVFREDLRDFDSRSEFVLSDISAAFANRTRVRERALDLLIPGYRETAQQINRTQQATKEKLPHPPPPTYQRLARLGRLAESRGVKVILVAMPEREDYELDPRLQTAVEAAGMTLLDSRAGHGLRPDSYVDEMHLGAGGAVIYSHFLARRLAPKLQGIFDEKRQAVMATGK